MPILCFAGDRATAFEYQLQPSIINNWVQTLDSQEPPATVSATARRTILFEGCANGVGNVGRKPGVATYALYNPDSDRVQFKTVHYGAKKGFQS